MFCPKCGQQNAEGSAFCRNCGASLSAANAQPGFQQTTVHSAYQQGTYAQPVKNPIGLSVVKKACSSPVALVAIIAYTIAAIFSTISSFADGLVTAFLQMGSVNDEVYYAMRSTSVVTIMIGIVPTVLIAVGLWMTYSSAVSRKYAGIKTSGLTMIKVTLIVLLVFVCVVLSLVEFVLLIAIAVFANGGGHAFYGNNAFARSGFEDIGLEDIPEAGLMAAWVIAVILIAVIMTLMILFYVKIVKSINTIRMTALTGNPSDDVSAFAAVMAFIAGGISALSVFENLFISVFAVLSNVCSATAYIAFGIFLFSYRNQMRAAMFGGGYTNMTQQTFAEPASFAFPSQAQPFSGQQTSSASQNTGNMQPTTAPTDAPQQDDSQQDRPQQDDSQQDEL